MWVSREVAAYTGGELIGNPEARAAGCIIDSRQVQGGEIFFALVGEKVDGHEFIEAAWRSGAAIVVAEKERLGLREPLEVPEDRALIQVDSGLIAMQALARAWREKLGAKVVGITGSNGKTTTKDMVAAVLAQKYHVHKNKENHNNELGLPLTILNALPGTEILVLEMGMRGLGQIKALCEIAKPDFGVITNIGTTHLELLGSEENIARAKWELIDALPAEGVAVLNAEDFWSCRQAEADMHARGFYGLKGLYHAPDLRGMNLQPFGTLGTRFEVVAAGQAEQAENITIELPLPGEHNVLDALAALSVGLLFGVSLQESCRGLAEMELSRMRLELHPGIQGSTLISDVYNANPTSMQASLKVLQERGGKTTLAILGDMYELGDASKSGHFAVGKAAAELGISELIAVGELAGEIACGAQESGMPSDAVYYCLTREEAVDKAREILERLNQKAWVLIKASRGMKMEEVTKALREG